MIYSVYWANDRVVVVDAPSDEAVEALILRERCDDPQCVHCAEFSYGEGVDGLSLKPSPITADGRFKRGFWESWFSPYSFGVVLWLFKMGKKPQNVYWPPHP